MPRTRSPSSSIRFGKLAALATVGLLAAVGLRGERADACGGSMYLGIEDVTAFDPSIARVCDVVVSQDEPCAGFPRCPGGVESVTSDEIRKLTTFQGNKILFFDEII